MSLTARRRSVTFARRRGLPVTGVAQIGSARTPATTATALSVSMGQETAAAGVQPTAGRLLVSAIAVDKGAGTITVGAGWTLARTPYVGASVSGAMAYRIAAGPDASTTEKARDMTCAWAWTSPHGAVATIAEDTTQAPAIATSGVFPDPPDDGVYGQVASPAGLSPVTGVAYVVVGIDTTSGVWSSTVPAFTNGYTQVAQGGVGGTDAHGGAGVTLARRAITQGTQMQTVADSSPRADQQFIQSAVFAPSSTPLVVAATTYDPDDLNAWQTRADSGPFRVAGDFAANSPGDWTRIVANKDDFVENPSSNRYTGTGQASDPSPSVSRARNMRDAAFYALVAEDASVAQTVITEMLAEQAGLDPASWASTLANDLHPGWSIMLQIGVKGYLTFDYLRPFLTATQRDTMRAWFLELGEWSYQAQEDRFNAWFVDRYAGNWTLAKASDGTAGDESSGYLWRDAQGNNPRIGEVQLFYNNRNMAYQMFYALLGADQDIAMYRNAAVQWMKDYIVINKNGWGPSELYRWTTAIPNLGLAYAVCLGGIGFVADIMRRRGDTSLYDFSSAVYHPFPAASGAAPIADSGTKTYLSLIKDFAGFMDGTFQRYAALPSQPERVGNATYRVWGKQDSRNVATGVIGPANLYYQDAVVADIAVYQHGTMGGFMATSISEYFSGVHAVYPGVLMQYWYDVGA